FPQEGAQTRFGIGFTCSSYTNNVEFTFDDANAILKGNDKLVAHSEADGGKLTGVAVALYDAQGNPIIMGTKQNIGSAQQGANTAYYQAAIVQTAAEITDSSSASFAGKITAKANVTITYY
ncbi:MAG: fimbrial protein, partial [Enterobacterales bacterium]|nr:fimbrial protein [Enterobacterales bacterium]